VGSLFANISGTFTKPVIIGMFFPALLFLLAIQLFVMPGLPWQPQVIEDLASLDTEWKLASFTLAAIVLTFFLYVLNIPIIRWYEGYPWERGSLGKRLASRHRRVLEREAQLLPGLELEVEALKAEVEAARTAQQDTSALQVLSDEVEDGHRRILESHLFEFPDPSAVLPTRLGNVIRAFETYPWKMYRMAAVPLWPRLIAHIDAGYAGAVDDAKSHFDFMLNLSFLSSILFFVIALLGLVFPVPFETTELLVVWLVKLFVTGALAWACYNGSISRAAEWGSLVRGAFDLYRRPLLTALGFTQTPSTLQEERDLWELISLQYSYGDPLDPEAQLLEFETVAPPLAPATDVVSIELAPASPDLQLTRGVTAKVKRARKVTTRIHNTGTLAMSNVTLSETLVNQQYLWGSARIGTKIVTPRGTNPYTFELGTINAGAHVDLEYEVAEP